MRACLFNPLERGSNCSYNEKFVKTEFAVNLCLGEFS